MLIGKYYQSFPINTSIDDMMKWDSMKSIMQHRPTFEKEEAEATYKYMLEDTFITEYKKTEELEKMICNYLSCKEMYYDNKWYVCYYFKLNVFGPICGR